MTVNATREVYFGYIIEVDIDDLPAGMNWEYWIEDPQGRLLSEGSFCKSREEAFTLAHEIIDASLRLPGYNDYQDFKEYPDFTG